MRKILNKTYNAKSPWIRSYQLHLMQEKGLAPKSVIQILAASIVIFNATYSAERISCHAAGKAAPQCKAD
jgi:hypothetical protein